jgi:murein DD-endopeptidase MepM/ murein hydrolase activator NlpD
MRWIEWIKIVISAWICFWSLGCSTVPPLPNERKGFFDQAEEGSGTEEVRPHRKSFFEHLTRAPLPRRRGKSIPRVEEPFDFKWPLRDVEITSTYGKRGKSFHEGVDLRARIGTPVYAAQTGVVLYSDSKIRGYGRMIVLRHDGQVATIYGHNSKLLVRRGDVVKQGQKIAISGNTGRSRGAHLHFEVRRGLSPVNPLSLLPRLAQESHSGALVATNENPRVRRSQP